MINEMTHRLRIYKRQVITDSHGGKNYQWVPGRYIFAGFSAPTADTATRSDQITVSEGRQFTARVGVWSLLAEGDRLQSLSGLMFEIRGLVEQPDKRFLTLNCREVR